MSQPSTYWVYRGKKPLLFSEFCNLSTWTTAPPPSWSHETPLIQTTCAIRILVKSDSVKFSWTSRLLQTRKHPYISLSFPPLCSALYEQKYGFLCVSLLLGATWNWKVTPMWPCLFQMNLCVWLRPGAPVGRLSCYCSWFMAPLSNELAVTWYNTYVVTTEVTVQLWYNFLVSHVLVRETAHLYSMDKIKPKTAQFNLGEYCNKQQAHISRQQPEKYHCSECFLTSHQEMKWCLSVIQKFLSKYALPPLSAHLFV